jgi:putative transposase
VDPGVIHPFAVAGPDGEGLLVSGRAIRAETHLHLRETKRRQRAVARQAPRPGQAGSRRWRKHQARQRKIEARHKRRVRQAQHEAARTVVDWAVRHRVGTLKVGDPRGVLGLRAGRRHNKRVRDWRIGHLIRCLKDKAEQAGINVLLVDERGTSSTCPACRRRVPKPKNRNFTCTHCGFSGHRDLVGGANIAQRTPAGGTITTRTVFPVLITHRRAGRHLPGAGRSRRDPRRSPHHGTTRGSPGRPRPTPPDVGTSLAQQARISQTPPPRRGKR